MPNSDRWCADTLAGLLDLRGFWRRCNGVPGGGDQQWPGALFFVRHHWSSAWLVDRFRKHTLDERDRRLGRIGLAMDWLAAAIQERRSAPAAPRSPMNLPRALPASNEPTSSCAAS
jgi:hypothetical protein